MAIDFSSINNYSFPSLEDGYAEDIKTFWKTFVEPRLPKEEIVIAWHELLMRYVNESDSIFVIRAFYNTDKAARRGFLTKTDKDFYFTYSDNGYAKMIAKMVYAGIVPQYDEFKTAMKTGKMPISEFMSKEEKVLSLYSYKRFNYSEYKLAHIIDAGKNFNIKGQNIGLTQICNEYFPAGNFNDWKQDNSIYTRNLSVSSEAREIITAHFLRFVDPLNYFITPKPLNKGISYQESKMDIKDIAEYEPLQQYAIQKFSDYYGSIYKVFLGILKLPVSIVNHVENEKTVGSKIIEIHWGKIMNSSKNIDPKRKNTRDTTKYSFDGINDYGKCAIPFEIVKDYIGKHPQISLSELKIAFPDGKNMCGVKVFIKKMSDLSSDEKLKNRYKDLNAPIILSSGEKIVVSTQFIPDTFESFKKVATKLGYQIIERK